MHNNYTIRSSSVTDITLIRELALATWEPTYQEILPEEQIDYMFKVIYSEDALQEQMQAGQTFMLLYKDKLPIGFAAYSKKDEEVGIYKLNKIYLLPEYQGLGAGKVLLQFVENEVKRLGCVFLDLNVNRYNKAKAFYERCGYTIHQQEDIPIGPYWMNDYVMRKEL